MIHLQLREGPAQTRPCDNWINLMQLSLPQLSATESYSRNEALGPKSKTGLSLYVSQRLPR